MMRFRTFLSFFFVICINFSLMAIENKLGYGRFRSHDGDSVKLIKQQLLYTATIDLINKSFDRLGLKKELFWEKFKEKRSLVKTAKIKALQNRYENKPTTLQEKKRLALLKIDRTFGRLRRLLTQYSIVKRSRSLEGRNIHLIKIRGVINESRLSKLYNSYIFEFEESSKVNIYLNLSVTNQNFLWEELGTDKIIIKKTLNTNILNYLKSSFNKTEIKIIPINDIEYIKSKIETGLYFKLNYKLTKTSESIDQARTNLSLKMSALVLDNSSNKSLHSRNKELFNYIFYYSTDDRKKKSLSDLVTTLYQFPLSLITKSKNIYFNTIPKYILKIEFNSFKNVSNVFKFIDFLNKRFVSKQGDVQIIKIMSGKIQAELYSIASIDKMIAMIQEMIPLNNDFKDMTVKLDNNFLSLSLFKKEGETNGEENDL